MDIALDVTGIFRIPGSAVQVRSLRDRYNRNEEINLMKENPHTVCSLLTDYLRNTEPLLSYDLASQWLALADVELPLADRVDRFSELVAKLPVKLHVLLYLLLRFLRKIDEHSAMNKMPRTNLATVFGPTLVRRLNASLADELMDMPRSARITIQLFDTVEYLFEGGIVAGSSAAAAAGGGFGRRRGMRGAAAATTASSVSASVSSPSVASDDSLVSASKSVAPALSRDTPGRNLSKEEMSDRRNAMKKLSNLGQFYAKGGAESRSIRARTGNGEEYVIELKYESIDSPSQGRVLNKEGTYGLHSRSMTALRHMQDADSAAAAAAEPKSEASSSEPHHESTVSDSDASPSPAPRSGSNRVKTMSREAGKKASHRTSSRPSLNERVVQDAATDAAGQRGDSKLRQGRSAKSSIDPSASSSSGEEGEGAEFRAVAVASSPVLLHPEDVDLDRQRSHRRKDGSSRTKPKRSSRSPSRSKFAGSDGSVESAPAESAPAESAPSESAPAESAPAEFAPVESSPTPSASPDPAGFASSESASAENIAASPTSSSPSLSHVSSSIAVSVEAAPSPDASAVSVDHLPTSVKKSSKKAHGDAASLKKDGAATSCVGDPVQTSMVEPVDNSKMDVEDPQGERSDAQRPPSPTRDRDPSIVADVSASKKVKKDKSGRKSSRRERTARTDLMSGDGE
jgi:hypothetical protein